MVDQWQYNGKTYLAWSEMDCNKVRGNPNAGVEQEEHPPHSWSSEFTINGPYLCWGYPYQGPKHRRPPAHRGDKKSETVSQL